MAKLDLLDFLVGLENYTVIKMSPSFPKFDVGEDDVDILCLNMNDVANHIISVLKNKYSNLTYRRFTLDGKVHVDINGKAPKRFIVKFDLCDDLRKMYPRYNIASDLTEQVVNAGVPDRNKCRIPTLADELMIRQLEYDTFIESRPKKIKHLRFIRTHPGTEYRKFVLS